jgi:hypothetical protein
LALAIGLAPNQVAGAEPSAAVADPAAALSAPSSPPSAAIVQLLLAGNDGLPVEFDPSSLFSVGDYLYAIGPIRQPVIHYFNRDATSGLLAYGGNLALPKAEYQSTASCVVGRRLYLLTTRFIQGDADNRLLWYDLDVATGKPIEKGGTEKLMWTDRPGHTESVGWGRMLAAGADDKTLFLSTDRAILHFKIENEGAITLAGELGNKGLGEYIFPAPGGKWLYAITHKPAPVVSIIECKPNGEMAAADIVHLDPRWGVNANNPNVHTEYSMSLSPDGRWLYAADWNQGGDDPDLGDISTTNSYLAILQRDPDTGKLKLADSGCGNDSARPDLKLANSRDLRLVFNPDGASGFVSTASGSLLRSFEFDPHAGRIEKIAEFPEWDTRRLETRFLWLDSKKKLLYGASGKPFGPGAYNVGAETHGMWVAKIGNAPTLPSPAVVPVLSGVKAPSGPADALDWPHWRGPTNDSKSPLHGIRRDWTGGLKKIWEVRGLSPGAHTWSMPAIQGNRLVVSGRHGFVDEFFCFDADTGGAPLWVAEIEGGEAGHFDWGSGSHAMAAIDGDKVFVTNLWGIAAAISMSDGKVLWKKLMAGGMYVASPLVYDDLVIYAGCNNYWHGFPLTAYHKDTGVVAWTYGRLPHSNSSPVLAKIDGRDQIVHIDQRELFGVDPRSGAEIWKYVGPGMERPNSDDVPISTPAIYGNIIFPAYAGCGTVQVDGSSAKFLWKRFTGGAHKVAIGAGTMLSDGVVIDGYMYHFTGSSPSFANDAPRGSLVCSELKTGKVQWIEDLGNGSLSVVDNCLLCLTYTGDLLLVQPTPKQFTLITEVKGFVPRDLWIGRQTARLNEPGPGRTYEELDYAPCWTSPVVARGKLYVHYSDRLACYDLMGK